MFVDTKLQLALAVAMLVIFITVKLVARDGSKVYGTSASAALKDVRQRQAEEVPQKKPKNEKLRKQADTAEVVTNGMKGSLPSLPVAREEAKPKSYLPINGLKDFSPKRLIIDKIL